MARRSRATFAQLLRTLVVGAAALVASACTTGTGTNPEPDQGPDGEPDPEPCIYPTAPAVMALDQPLPHFSWPNALDAERNDRALDLERALCDDEDIDWSPFDVLLFISIPAW